MISKVRYIFKFNCFCTAWWQQHLLRHFGGLSGLKAAAVDDIARVEGVNRGLAERIWASLHGLGQAGAGEQA
jgi:DNA integrity scanning protein DisA with diadenylate cyclase activity